MKKEDGFTLLEVLSGLLIAGIILITALNLLEGMWKGSRTLKGQLEAQYALMTAGRTVSDEIRRAKTVQWDEDACELKVLPPIEEENPSQIADSYFVADLDYDGIKDLYWKHMGVPQPIASFMTGWESVEVEPGLWEIILKVTVDKQSVTSRQVIRQRVYPSASSQSAAPEAL
ncbi:prepilin-type N-terminal cleavage/methylation domain-containing protein [Desulfosporosinus sp. FKA]|uniref:PilW family protein n=1 Tax=Desulfosporosinus sp. FKA TaxID=1969834 RepID=UPI001FA8E958|nr:prepilin-type N-terminal cleavage/methylation domain-containing protein [Desulfosporosinus sp. FKA]